MYAYTHVYTYIHIYIDMYILIYMYYIYIHIYMIFFQNMRKRKGCKREGGAQRGSFGNSQN